MIIEIKPEFKRIRNLLFTAALLFLEELIFWEISWESFEYRAILASVFVGIPILQIVHLINNPRTIEINETEVIYKGQFYTQKFEKNNTFFQKYRLWNSNPDSFNLYKLFDHKNKAYVRGSQINEDDIQLIQEELSNREEVEA